MAPIYSQKKADLATWPGDVAHSSPPAARYAELLRRAVLEEHSRVLIESVIIAPDASLALPGGPTLHYTSYARISLDGVTLRTGIRAFGTTAQAAKDAAELRALRIAVGIDDVPMLGRLLTRENLTVDLLWTPGSTASGEFELVISLLGAAAGLQTGVVGPPYKLPVQITKFDRSRGTSYLRARALSPGLIKLLAPYHSAVLKPYVHRLVLALDRRPMSNVGAWNAARIALGLPPLRGHDRHGHHLDGDGLNCGIWNITPLQIQAHYLVHRGDPCLSPALFTLKGTSGGGWPIMIPAPTLLTRHGPLGQPAPDSIWGSLSPLSGVENDAWGTFPTAPGRLPITEAEILQSGVRRDFADSLKSVLDALRKDMGQGTHENVKNATCSSGLSETTVRRALAWLVEMGMVNEVKLTGKVVRDRRPRRGELAHFRLSRPLGW